MLNLQGLYYAAKAYSREHSPEILTGLAVSGTVSTAILSFRAGYKTAHRLSEGPPVETRPKMEVVRESWDLAIVPVISGATTVGCIFGAYNASSKRTAAALSLLAVSERTLLDYRDKVVEQIGAKKEEKIQDAVVQERVDRNPPPAVLVAGDGDVLCLEDFTGRYITSNRQSLESAVNKINNKAQHEGVAFLSDFYYEIGMEQTPNAYRMGWDVERLMELEVKAAFAPDGRPCLVFDYNYVDLLQAFAEITGPVMKSTMTKKEVMKMDEIETTDVEIDDTETDEGSSKLALIAVGALVVAGAAIVGKRIWSRRRNRGADLTVASDLPTEAPASEE